MLIDFCSGGAIVNSPAIHRGVKRRKVGESRKGRKKLSSLRDFNHIAGRHAINRVAINKLSLRDDKFQSIVFDSLAAVEELF